MLDKISIYAQRALSIMGKCQQTQPVPLQWICRSVLNAAFPEFNNTEVEASFYPYIGLTHTIRRKGSVWKFRISDYCRHAPEAVLESIIVILACKATRRKPGRKYLRTYEAFRKYRPVLEAIRERRVKRGRKYFAVCSGKVHSLQRIYQELNSRYFNDQIEIRRIGWGIRRSRNRLGHYDPVHHTITLSPVLDSREVPEFVVQYIVYHEMLHAVFEDGASSGVRKYHPPEYRRAEKAYPDYARAKRFLTKFCAVTKK
jgi:hypothetical protein